jgi:hypothetical protein
VGRHHAGVHFRLIFGPFLQVRPAHVLRRSSDADDELNEPTVRHNSDGKPTCMLVLGKLSAGLSFAYIAERARPF